MGERARASERGKERRVTASPLVSESVQVLDVSPTPSVAFLQIVAQYALCLFNVSADVYVHNGRARERTRVHLRVYLRECLRCMRVRDGVGRMRLSLRARDWLYRFCAVAVSRHLVVGARASERARVL